MLTSTANEESREDSPGAFPGESRLSYWLRVREFAVPSSMIETATARRRAGDWAGACAAAGIDVDLSLRALARTHGTEFAARLRADLRHLAPDLLRWHMPRVAPYGLLRPGLTVALARYEDSGRGGARAVYLVVRTPPAWAAAGQRMSLALWDGSHRSGSGAHAAHRSPHPHPHPNRRFRLDLHRHLWDVRRADELRVRCGAGDRAVGEGRPSLNQELLAAVPEGYQCAVDRWAAEAVILLRAEGRLGMGTGTDARTDPRTETVTETRTNPRTVTVRLGTRHRLHLDLDRGLIPDSDGLGPFPVLPDAATWALPDLDLLRAGAIDPGRLHPLVASALVPGHTPSGHGPSHPSRPSPAADPAGQAHVVECRGAAHRIGLVGGVLAPLDHDPAEIRREELLAELGGTPLPCLHAIDRAHRQPDCIAGVRERLHHGDIAGALAVVEGLLGPGAVLRDGALRDELERAAAGRIAYGLFRAGLAGPGPGPVRGPVPRPVSLLGGGVVRAHPDRHRPPDRLPGRPLDRREHPRLATHF
ncbi:hypothetical protein ACIQNU_29475 [Streptomyces sp. NPDC091292]|uniref:hypothetical protein n=1 Tax=Streptomyces sp. NPDC091292 TaxID=3365991 RepID=UPI003826E4F2